MAKFGLLGRTLGHSWSPQIHSVLGSSPYDLCEVEPEALEGFLRGTDADGLNVTIPYKKAVLPFCTRLSDVAKESGSVNTLVREGDGWFGTNTDFDGFLYTVRKSGVSVMEKKALVFGSGGVSGTICHALKTLGAASVTVISRSGEDNYENLDRHADAQVLVNCTPVGMYPKVGEAVVSLDRFPRCECVFDLIYNPTKTALLLDAEARGIPFSDGLPMLVAQAVRASELFQIKSIPDELIRTIERTLRMQMQNIVLVGMPGCGKSTLGKLLADALSKRFVDLDEEIVRTAGKDIETIFREEGEAGFRKRETAEIVKWGKESGLVLATGGGCVTRSENRAPLRQNGTVVWIKRAIDALPTDGRPLSKSTSLTAMYETREPLYKDFSDLTIDNIGAPEEVMKTLLEVLK
ncbi:MAG: shikimate kinase [Oscillospiraceae bacterium]|nr:shikimate kinase [Oscillospiraceae bacterium]